MAAFFATIYETIFGIYNNSCNPMFRYLFYEGGYVKLGLIFLLVTIALWLLFYFVWRHPYGRLGHWLLWLLVTVLIVLGVTLGTANIEVEVFLSKTSNVTQDCQDHIRTLPLKYGLANTALAAVLSLVYSLILKQFSKVQMHLPF